MNIIDHKIATIPIDVSAIPHLKESVTAILKKKFIEYETTEGRCVAKQLNMGLDIKSVSYPKTSEKKSANVTVSYSLRYMIFPTSFVIKDCIYISHTESNFEFTDDGFFEFQMPESYDPVVRKCVKLMVESQFLLAPQRAKLASIDLNSRIDLKIIDTVTFEPSNTIVCKCMYDDGTIPVFKLEVLHIKLLNLPSLKEGLLYTVAGGKVVEAQKNDNNYSVTFLSDNELLEYVKFLIIASKPNSV